MGVTLHEKLNEQPVIKPYVEMNNKPVESEILECVNKYVGKTPFSSQDKCDFMEQKPVWNNFMTQFFEEQPLDQIREKLDAARSSNAKQTDINTDEECNSCDPFSDASISLMEKILGVDLNVKPFGPDGFNDFVAKRDRISLLLSRALWKHSLKR